MLLAIDGADPDTEVVRFNPSQMGDVGRHVSAFVTAHFFVNGMYVFHKLRKFRDDQFPAHTALKQRTTAADDLGKRVRIDSALVDFGIQSFNQPANAWIVRGYSRFS